MSVTLDDETEDHLRREIASGDPLAGFSDRDRTAISTLCSGRTAISITREEALFNFYSAERRAGSTPLEANERMHFFAKRLDAEFERDLAVIRNVMERTR